MAVYARGCATLAAAEASHATWARVAVGRGDADVVVRIDSDVAHDPSDEPGWIEVVDRIGAVGGERAHVDQRCGRNGVSGVPVRVVVADDVMLVRSGLARLLADAGIDVVGEAADASGLLSLVGRLLPDVAIVDIRMPPTHTDEGLVAARLIRERHPQTAVVLLSQYVEPRYAERLLADQPGGLGYLLKERVSDIAVLVDGAAARVGGRVRDRPDDRRPADAAATRGLAARSPDRPRARGARLDGGGPLQRRHRRAVGHRRAHRRGVVRPGVPEARPRTGPQRQPSRAAPC